MKKFRNLAFASVALVGGLVANAVTASALGVTIPENLTLELAPLSTYQQTTNSPCVIGENSCQGSLPHTLLPNNNVSWADIYSPVYTVDDLDDYVTGAFWIGIDINQTVNPQTLVSFVMLVNGLQVFAFNTTTSVPDQANGNGFADYLLKGFSLANLALTDTVQFNLNFTGQNDGKEQFFLIDAADASPIPAPAALPLLLTGLAGLGWLARRRARKT